MHDTGLLFLDLTESCSLLYVVALTYETCILCVYYVHIMLMFDYYSTLPYCGQLDQNLDKTLQENYFTMQMFLD